MTCFPKSKLLFLPISYKLFGQLNRFFFFCICSGLFSIFICPTDKTIKHLYISISDIERKSTTHSTITLLCLKSTKWCHLYFSQNDIGGTHLKTPAEMFKPGFYCDSSYCSNSTQNYLKLWSEKDSLQSEGQHSSCTIKKQSLSHSCCVRATLSLECFLI